MPDAPPHIVNGFATGISRLFALSAKGLDSQSERFFARRPYERILTGFLTAVEELDHNEGQPVPDDLPQDDSYEQTNIGFEWCAPIGAITSASEAAIQIGFNTYVRVLPTFEEAASNARFRQGTWRVAEVWQRVSLADLDASPLTATIPLADLVARRSLTLDFHQQVAARQVPSLQAVPGIFRGRRPLEIHEPDLRDSAAYKAWLDQHSVAGQPAASFWKPSLDVRFFPSPTEPGCARILLRVVNKSEPATAREAAFWDPRFYAVSARCDIPLTVQQDSEFRILPNSYRYDRRTVAIGINCQPRSERVNDRLVLHTETVPILPRQRIVPRIIPNAEPSFASLAANDCGLPRLRNILAAMRDYDSGSWQTKVNELSEAFERRDAETDRAQFKREIESFAKGIALLEEGGAGALAFRHMNETMRRLGLTRRRVFEDWHLFQIVFIVAALPTLVGNSKADLEAHDNLNLLWFPAGGGKTEAFLGLLIWHAFFDRLRGKALGVTAFLRYPLRLLTYQQLQRLSRALGKAEEIRVEQGIGGEEFSVGYLVGESTTPNKISEEMHTKLRGSGIPKEWQRIFTCPTCDARNVGLRYNEGLRLIEHYCAEARCPSGGRRLPIYICDDDLYRYLPTVIVSTVDKLAGLGQNRRFTQLFGRLAIYCRRHGAAFGGSNSPLCAASTDLKLGRPAVRCSDQDVLIGPFEHVQPSLHIQDELHLLRESLATFDSHYETAAMAIQRRLAPDGRRWALIGSTATIEGFREQARHLYLTNATRFPCPGPEAYDSFYYRTDGLILGRLFVGVLGVGRAHTPSVARTIGLLHGIVEGIRRDASTDLDNVRNKLGLPDVSTEQLQQLAFQYEVVLTYVLTRKGGDQVGEAIDSRVRTEIEQLGEAALRVESFNSGVEMPRMIETMEEVESCTMATPLNERVRGVIATNIISHGVDIDRFNVMVFAGLPRQFAEYIQASARVGRQLPGISVLVVTPHAERDRSVLDRFDKFHEYVDRLVEPVPINRWSEPALELTLRGVIAAYLMGVAAADIGRELYLVKHVRDLFGQPGYDVLSEAALVEWVTEALGGSTDEAPAGFAQTTSRLAARLYGTVTGASADKEGAPLNTHLLAMRSLRDIDDPASIFLPSQEAGKLKMMGM